MNVKSRGINIFIFLWFVAGTFLVTGVNGICGIEDFQVHLSTTHNFNCWTHVNFYEDYAILPPGHTTVEIGTPVKVWIFADRYVDGSISDYSYPCTPGSTTECCADKPIWIPVEKLKVRLSSVEWIGSDFGSPGGGSFQDTILTTDKYGKATTTFIPSRTGTFVIKVTPMAWDWIPPWSDKTCPPDPCAELLVGGKPLENLGFPPGGDSIEVLPHITGKGTQELIPFGLTLEPEKTEIATNQTINIIARVAYQGYPDPGRKIDLTYDGGYLQPTSGLTNSSGIFTASFSSPEPGTYSLRATTQRMAENLNDSRLIQIKVFTPNIAYARNLQNDQGSAGTGAISDIGNVSRGSEPNIEPVRSPTFFDLIASFPRTIMSLAHLSSSQENGGTPSAAVAGITRVPATGIQDEPMHVVVLPEPVITNPELMQNTGRTVPVITPTLPVQWLKYTQVYMNESPEGSNVTPSQDQQISIPKTFIGYEPTMATYRPLPCPSGYVNCNGQCVDLMTDTAYCGSCNSTCPSQFTCVAGVCTPQCSSGQSLCNGACIGLLTDSNNCGACGNLCTTGGTCENGQCVVRMAITQPTHPGDLGIVRQHL